MLTESQLAALEKAKSEKGGAWRVRERMSGGYWRRPGYVLRRQHEGAGCIYQQTFIDTYAKVAHAKLYDRKTPITAADLVNDRVVPFYDAREVRFPAAC